ncbi:MAG: MFS transporter [Acholeplasmatales bacterium]|jgi:MFS family permease|nr:MFS transporter [Acholeplasmataceae bacterium]MDY0114919.1 MFS transporter [Acholeplasmatales bacterium]MCK9233821.1 MFS transporter [Acholeplasmataceae bacterium]MCK9289516.1 MFS transporter [Acholeplasmataceae bacterium]MCK9427140.1 MFS transporter [Acholeplasmataceae bacterium]
MKEESKYKITNFLRYYGDALFYPFLALYFSHLNKTESQIGFLLMLIPLLGAILNPFWSLASKNINYNRKIIIFLSLIEAVVIIYLTLVVKLPYLVIGALLLAIVGQPFYVLFDGFTAVYTISNEVSFGRLRLFGSIGFAIGALMGGYFLKLTSFYLLFSLASIAFVLVSLMLIWIKPLNLVLNKTLTEKPQPKQLFKNKKYLKFSMFFIISMGILFSGEAFLGVFFKSLEISSDRYGIVVFIQVIIEALILFLLTKWKHKKRLMFVMVFIVLANFIRFFSFNFSPPLILLILVSIFRAVSMGGLLFVSVEYMKINVSAHNITLGIVLFYSVKNVLQAIYTFIGGYFIERYSYQSFYLMTAFITLTALFFIDYRSSYDTIEKGVEK